MDKIAEDKGESEPLGSLDAAVRVLVASTSPTHGCALFEHIVGRLVDRGVELAAVCDASLCSHGSLAVRTIAWKNIEFVPTHQRSTCTCPAGYDAGLAKGEAADLAAWAQLMIVAPMDANNMARMLHGMADSSLQEILRIWDVNKKILLIPGMSDAAWENPMTKKQLTKIRKKWNWIQILPPLLWVEESAARPDTSETDHPQEVYHGMDEFMSAFKNQLDLATIGNDRKSKGVNYYSEASRAILRGGATPQSPASSPPRLPPEIWTIIVDYTEDWELAHALHVHTALAVPTEWQWISKPRETLGFDRRLELELLHGSVARVRRLFESTPCPPKYLSRLSIRLIMQFAQTGVLRYLEAAHTDLFWSAFGHAFIPNAASGVFGRTALLEYWRTSPAFLSKDYGAAAVDDASANGFVHVLEWWRRHSGGLALRYTDASLEQASGRGHVDVLAWWRAQSKYADSDSDNETNNDNDNDSNNTTKAADGGGSSSNAQLPPLALRVGKSICHAAQSGSLAALRWWAGSGVPFAHEDTVAKLASAHGHVRALDFWLAHRGPAKLLFDSQVLVAPTRLGHVAVLEWWGQQARGPGGGLRVEYKTCDIEEALEDGGGADESLDVRRWWARNGLNLGVGTSEWMQTKMLA